MHLYLDTEKMKLMNSINYMSNFLKETRFIGFLPVAEKIGHWTLNVDGTYFCALHLFREERITVFSDDTVAEQKAINKGKNWLLVLYGTDNTSYAKRFLTEKYAVDWINKTKEKGLQSLDGLFFYNS
tara:strand:- start:721 stop:1101 length:381 start_codon:yes stop_codon:yes gene_type:complete